MERIKAILFDLDGTILDSKKSTIDAVYYISQKYRPNRFTYEDIASRFGESLDEFIDSIADNNKEIIFRDYMEYITANHDKEVLLFPKVTENLFLLKKEGFKLAITTNKQRILTYKALSLFHIEDLFDTVISLDDVKNGKPDGEMIKLACYRLNVNHSEAILVGDSIFDIKAAQSANVKAALLDWYDDFQEFQDHRLSPDYYIKSLEEFIDKVLCLNDKEGIKVG